MPIRHAKLGEELEHLEATQLSPQHDFPARVDAVNQENVLGDIDADGANLHLDAP